MNCSEGHYDQALDRCEDCLDLCQSTSPFDRLRCLEEPNCIGVRELLWSATTTNQAETTQMVVPTTASPNDNTLDLVVPIAISAVALIVLLVVVLAIVLRDRWTPLCNSPTRDVEELSRPVEETGKDAESDKDSGYTQSNQSVIRQATPDLAERSPMMPAAPVGGSTTPDHAEGRSEEEVEDTMLLKAFQP